MSQLRLYLDANGKLGVIPEDLTPPLVSVKKMEIHRRQYDTYSCNDGTWKMYDILCPEGLGPSHEHGFRFTLDITPPTPVSAIMIQGPVDYIKLVGTGSHASIEYPSSKHEPLSLLPCVSDSLTFVALRSKGVCTKIIVSCDGISNLPNIRFVPIFANYRVHMPQPAVESLGQMLLSDNSQNFIIRFPHNTHPENLIRVHRDVLLASSEYFVKVVQHTQNIKQMFIDSIDVQEPFDVWSEIVNFMYTRSVTTDSVDLMLKTLPFASMFLLPDMCKLLAFNVEMHIRSQEVVPMVVVEALAIADRFQIASLKRECDDYMQANSSTLILNRPFMSRYTEITYSVAQTSQDPETDYYDDDA